MTIVCTKDYCYWVWFVGVVWNCNRFGTKRRWLIDLVHFELTATCCEIQMLDMNICNNNHERLIRAHKLSTG